MLTEIKGLTKYGDFDFRPHALTLEWLHLSGLRYLVPLDWAGWYNLIQGII